MTLLYMDWKTFLKSTTTATRSKFLKLCSFWTFSEHVYVLHKYMFRNGSLLDLLVPLHQVCYEFYLAKVDVTCG